MTFAASARLAEADRPSGGVDQATERRADVAESAYSGARRGRAPGVAGAVGAGSVRRQ